MANSIDYQVTEEGPRNAVVKLTGYLDTSNVSELPAIALAQFVNNDTRLRLNGLRVDLLEWAISGGIEVQLAWHSNSPQQMFPLSGRGRINSTNYGGFIPDRTRSGYTGDIDLITTGYVPGTIQNFSVVLEFVKLYSV
jgi:hypothetical protein